MDYALPAVMRAMEVCLVVGHPHSALPHHMHQLPLWQSIFNDSF